MTRSGLWRSGLVAFSLAAVLGGGALVAAPAHADAREDAQNAITALAGQIEDGDADAGFRDSGLGDRDGDLESMGAGFAQEYDGGTIYWSADTGAHVLYGAIDEKYGDLGGPDGDTELGFPTESEADGPFQPASREAAFAGEGSPKIYWTPNDGAWLVRGPFAAASDRLGNDLGAPTADLTVDGDVISQSFTAGTLNYNVKDGAWTSAPASLAAGLDGLTLPDSPNLGLPGVDLPEITAPNVNAPNVSAPNVSAPNADSDGISPWWWLLLLLIPLLALLWWLLSRRRKQPQTVVHAGRPTGGPDLPKVDLKGAGSRATGTAAAGTAAAGAAAAGAAAGAVKKATGGDGVGSYFRAGERVPVPVGAHLPLQDPKQAPDGYPIKGDAESGLFHTPQSPAYSETTAAIWFATEGAAKSAGFSPVNQG